MTVRPSSSHSILIGVAAASTAATLLFLLWQVREVFALVMAAILVALALSAGADWLKQRGLPRALALALLVVAIVGALVLAFALAGPGLAEDMKELRERFPQSMERLKESVGRYELGRRLIDEAPKAAEGFSRQHTVFSRLTGIVSATLGAILTFVVILFLGLVMAAAPDTYLRGGLALVSPGRRPRVRQALLEAAGAMRAWLLTKLLLMVVIGVGVGIGLMLLKVPGAFVLGLLAALLTFIPNFGPFLAAAPAVLLGFAQGPQTALYVVLLYLGVQAVETYVLDPILDKKIVALPPGLTLTMQIVLGLLLGAVGLAVATPLTAAGVVLIRRLYVEDVLGDL